MFTGFSNILDASPYEHGGSPHHYTIIQDGYYCTVRTWSSCSLCFFIKGCFYHIIKNDNSKEKKIFQKDKYLGRESKNMKDQYVITYKHIVYLCILFV